MAHLENNCTRYEEVIQEYVDGRGALPMPAFLQAHLEKCGVCRAALEEYQLIDKGARQLPSLGAPEGLLTDIMENIAAFDGKCHQGRGFLETFITALGRLIPAYGLAIIAAVLFLTLCLLGSPELHSLALQGDSTFERAGIEYVNSYAGQSLAGTIETLEGISAYWQHLLLELSDRFAFSRLLSSAGSHDPARVGWYTLSGLIILFLVNYALIRQKEKGGHSSCAV
jgi:hypothetical protein